jgi:hypothetical protein
MSRGATMKGSRFGWSAGLIGATIAVVVGAVLLWRQSTQPPKGGESFIGEGAITDLREEVGRLRREMRASRAFAGAATSAVSAEARARDLAYSEDPPTEDSPAAVNRPVISKDEIRRRTWERFHDEAVDPSWSKTAEDTARRQLLRGLPKSSQILNVACHTTMCRGELVHKDLGTYQEYFMEMLQSTDRDWKGNVAGSLLQTREDGSVVVEAYFFRPGEDPVRDLLADDEMSPKGTHQR